MLSALVLVVGFAGGVHAEGVQRQDEPLRVMVPSSLAQVADRVADRFTDRTGIAVIVVSDATSRIVGQLQRGAPADLLITADSAWMAEAVALGLASNPVEIAANALVLIEPEALSPSEVPSGSDGVRVDIDALFRNAGGRVAMAGEEVPAGRYARAALTALGIGLEEIEIATGGSVRTALEWVARGEARHGLVYASDAAVEPRVRVVHRFDPATHARITYLAARTAGADAATDGLLNEFRSAGDILDEAGFAPGGARSDRPGLSPENPGPRQLPPHPGGPSLPSAVLLSVVVAFLAVVVGTVPAVAVGRLLATRSFPGRTLVSAILLAPLVIPPVVTGFLLLSLFGTNAPLGRALGSIGIQVPFTPLAAVLAAAVVGLPLYAVVVRSAFQAVDRRYEELSWTLGVPPRSTFRRVVLPLALPGIAAGAVLAFARALGEFGATIVIAGNVEGETRTIPLAVYSLLETPGVGGRIWFFVGASLVLSLAGLVAYESLIDRQRRQMEDGRVG